MSKYCPICNLIVDNDVKICPECKHIYSKEPRSFSSHYSANHSFDYAQDLIEKPVSKRQKRIKSQGFTEKDYFNTHASGGVKFLLMLSAIFSIILGAVTVVVSMDLLLFIMESHSIEDVYMGTVFKLLLSDLFGLIFIAIGINMITKKSHSSAMLGIGSCFLTFFMAENVSISVSVVFFLMIILFITSSAMAKLNKGYTKEKNKLNKFN